MDFTPSSICRRRTTPSPRCSRRALDLWQRGLLPDDTAYPEIRRIAAEHNPRSRTPEGASRQEISRSSTRDWPTAWKEVLGIEPMARADEAELVTIAELTAGRSGARPVRAELKGIGGSSDRFLATASDGTGAVTVFFMRERTTNYPDASGSGWYDLWLEPLPASAQAAESVRPLVDVGHALYLVTKVVPL